MTEPIAVPDRVDSDEDGSVADLPRDTRSRLLDAGLAALAGHGYHAVRVDDVVEVAGVSHGTFYLYFANKEDLFAAMAQHCAADMSALADRLTDLREDSDGEELASWVAQFMAMSREHGPVIRAWAERHVGDRRLRAVGRDAFARITAAFRERIDADGRVGELRAIAMLAMIERFSYVAATRDLGRSTDDLASGLAAVVQRAFLEPSRPVSA